MPFKALLAGLALVCWPLAGWAEPASQAPASVDQPIPDLGGPLSPQAQELDAQILASLDQAESRQGPLDGGWRLSSTDGAPLFEFQLADAVATSLLNPSGGEVQGAWRDLGRRLTATSSGFLAQVHRDSDTLVLRFYIRDEARPTVVSLRALDTSHWTGTLTDEGGLKRLVNMARP